MNDFGSDKGQHGYAEIYEKHFESIRNSVKSVLELGVYEGKSLKMWREFFPNAQIHGLDIDSCRMRSGDGWERIRTWTGSQINYSILNQIVGECGGSIDIVIDDASHINKLITKSFDFLFPFTNMFYCVEDLLLSYQDITQWLRTWPGQAYNAGTNLQNDRKDIDNLITESSHKIDRKEDGLISLHIYNMMMVFSKVKTQ